MSVSMHELAVPVLKQGLRGLDIVAGKGAAFVREGGAPEDELIDARLAPDMFPLVSQFQIATDHAKGSVSRLAGREVPSWPDTERSFAEIRVRIARAIDYVDGFSPDELAGSEAREIRLKLGDRAVEFSGLRYLTGFALPNFYFHLTTAYDILRSRGVLLGKRDFMGRG
jgi:hypothetical protein